MNKYCLLECSFSDRDKLILKTCNAYGDIATKNISYYKSSNLNKELTDAYLQKLYLNH